MKAISIPTRLTVTFLLVIVVMSVVFTLVGVQFIASRVVAEAQSRVRTDLNSARELYANSLNSVTDVVRFTADRFILLREALLGRNLHPAARELAKIRIREKLDVFTVTDVSGRVLIRSANPALLGDDQSQDALVQAVVRNGQPVAATQIVPAEELRKESPHLAEQAYFQFIPTPKARARAQTEESAGMMLKAAAPVVDADGKLIGILYGGVLLNRNFDLVDKIKQTVFQGVLYKGKDIGTATIFQDDFRIATNVLNEDGTRAVGTRISEEVYTRVVKEGKPWIGRAYVVNDWYITAYEPIRSLDGRIIGILYVGLLEAGYRDLKQRSILLFLGVTLAGALLAMTLAYFLSRTISEPIQMLVAASREVAHGNLDAKVEVPRKDELGELADAFNSMATEVKARDQRLREYARNKIMESERLALIGQLAAGVAHELNNPLQGIVSYSHLLLEKIPAENPVRGHVEKVVTQANRCTAIIRGLLDFSRQTVPQKKRVNLNAVLEECVALMENQALFQNIRIRKELQEDLPPVVVDPTEMQQVFMNMIINAAEAMDGQGQLTLVTRLDTSEPGVEVRVTDTGHGIAPENVEKIFDPFFTTKEAGHGTGLGLAISYGIVKEHEGTITVDSQLGKGTTFTVRLPVAQEEAYARIA